MAKSSKSLLSRLLSAITLDRVLLVVIILLVSSGTKRTISAVEEYTYRVAQVVIKMSSCQAR